MKFASFEEGGRVHFGLVTEHGLADLHEADAMLPDNALEFIRENEKYLPMVSAAVKNASRFYALSEVKLLPPLPNPESFRDFMGFNEHVETCRRNRNETVDPVYYEIPVFYFSNTKSFVASGVPVTAPKKCQKLDFEFEVGIVIGKEGRDIKREEANDYIFGYTILNDWSARDIQLQEMKVKLGPAKGKDFATSMGPFLVTKDEFEPYRDGMRFNRGTRLTVNGRVMRENNLNAIYHDFGAMIERASEDVTLYPGELLGSGTIGGGCIMEFTPAVIPWLAGGDRLDLEVEGLGKLECIVK